MQIYTLVFSCCIALRIDPCGSSLSVLCGIRYANIKPPRTCDMYVRSSYGEGLYGKSVNTNFVGICSANFWLFVDLFVYAFIIITILPAIYLPALCCSLIRCDPDQMGGVHKGLWRRNPHGVLHSSGYGLLKCSEDCCHAESFHLRTHQGTNTVSLLRP